MFLANIRLGLAFGQGGKKGMESERIILSYLKNRGLKQTEASLRSEAKLQKLTTDPNLDSIPEFLIFYNEKESNEI